MLFNYVVKREWTLIGMFVVQVPTCKKIGKGPCGKVVAVGLWGSLFLRICLELHSYSQSGAGSQDFR